MIAPRYRTDAMACSCKGFWFRRSCKHIIAYREAVALVPGCGESGLGHGKGR